MHFLYCGEKINNYYIIYFTIYFRFSALSMNKGKILKFLNERGGIVLNASSQKKYSV